MDDYGSVENLTILEIHSCKDIYEGSSRWGEKLQPRHRISRSIIFVGILSNALVLSEAELSGISRQVDAKNTWDTQGIPPSFFFVNFDRRVPVFFRGPYFWMIFYLSTWYDERHQYNWIISTAFSLLNIPSRAADCPRRVSCSCCSSRKPWKQPRLFVAEILPYL